MKKIFKVIIAFVIIAVVAVGAYFIFRPKDNSLNVYNNVYSLNYKVEKNNINVVKKVDETINEMLVIIENNSLNVGNSKNSLQNFVNLRDAYSSIKVEILSYANFCKSNGKANNFIANVAKNYSKISDAYLKAYDYLTGTYFKIVDGTYTKATMETYITNFENLFKDVYIYYNDFYFNACVAYARTLDNMMVKNNAYKLKVEYVGNLINKFYSEGNFNSTFLDVAKNEAQKLSLDFAKKYFENKIDYDELINQAISLDISTICEKVSLGQIDSYITELPTEADRIVVQKYVNLVARG